MKPDVFERDGLRVHWLGGGVYLERDGLGLLLDVPAHAADALDAIGALPRLTAIAISGGRIRSVGGLVPLLCALEDHRHADDALLVWSPYGEERPALLADAWQRGWPDAYPLVIETGVPGSQVDAGPFQLRTEAIRRAELRRGRVEIFSAVAFRVSAGPEVAWIPGAGPGGIVRTLCRGSDLAIVEVGVRPWPSTEEPWRLTTDRAVRAAAEAAEVWIVGDDGRLVSGGNA